MLVSPHVESGLEPGLVEKILRLARENPRWGSLRGSLIGGEGLARQTFRCGEIRKPVSESAPLVSDPVLHTS
jgi:hypothetical protein